MAPVNIKYIVSFSSQDDGHRASNLLASDGSKLWLSDRKDTSGKSEVILQLVKPSQLAYLDIGSVWCATLEVRVGRSDWPQTMEFKPLIPTFMLMTPLDCRLSRGFKSTQMFSKKDFSQEVARESWDRLHIICRQPHRRDVQLGLSFVHIRDACAAAPPGNLSAPVSGPSALSPIGGSPLGKSAVNASSIQKHFFGDVNKTGGDSPTDRLKYRLMKMAGSTEHGCEQEQALSRTAKLVLKASESHKSYSPQRTSSPLPRTGLFSEHVAKKNDVSVPEEMKSFLQTLNVTAADIDKVTIADLRHKLERRKKRKLTKEERHTFSEICQDFFYYLFDKSNEPAESGHPCSVVGSKVQSDVPETNTFVGKLSKEPVKSRSDGKIQKTPNRKRTSQINQTENVRQTDLPDVSTKAEMNRYGKPESVRLNTCYNQNGWIKSSAVATSVEDKVAANESSSKILPSTVLSSVRDGQIFIDEKHKEIMPHLNAAVSRDLTSHQQKLSLKTPFSSPCQNLPTHTNMETVSKDTISRGNVNSAGADVDSTSSLSDDSDSHFVCEGDTSQAASPCPSPGRKIVTTEDINKLDKIVTTEDINKLDKIVTTEDINKLDKIVTTEDINKPDKIVTTEDINKPNKIVTTEDINKPDKIVTTEDINKADKKAYSQTGQDKTPASVSSSKLKRWSKASFDIFQEFSMEIMNDDNDESTCKTDNHDRSSVRESIQSEHKIEVNSQITSLSMNDTKTGNGTPQKIKSHSNETELMKKTPKSAKGKIYRMHTSRNKLNVSHTRNSSDLQHKCTVSETLPDSCHVDRLGTLVNQNCPDYLNSCNKDKYVTSPDKASRRQTVSVRATELCAPTFHNSWGNKRTKRASDTSISIPSRHSSDRSSQSSRTGQKSKEHSSRRRTRSNPSTLLQDSVFCENCYGQYPADVLPAHRAFCTPVRPVAPPAASASPDELLIDEAVDCGECPICLQRFPQDVLLVHASECGV